MGLILLMLGVRSQPQAAAEPAETRIQHATTIDTNEAKRLAERYAPIVMVRVQESMCDTDGEPYLPVPVDLVLGNPDVTLRQNDGGARSDDPVLVTAPVAGDLATAGADTYLDFPGNPRDPKCTYERWYKADMAGHDPAVYARVAETDTDQVVIQYHLYYVFNDFNNTHESDWEMVQLLFDAPTVAQAREPLQIAYAQHGGGETALWDDDKLTREGDHVVVYPAAGSHASQYGTETYLGWGAGGTGFGCDNTQEPVRRVDVTPILLTSSPREPDSPQAWLAWEGRWGQRQPWEYNGPLGPATTGKWADPVGWQEGLRDSSIIVPGASAFGPGPTEVFCDATAFGSMLLTRWAVAPWTVASVVMVPLAIFVGLLVLSRRTIVAAFYVYRRHLPVFAAFGLVLIPIGLLANGFQYLIVTYPPGRAIAEVMRFSPASDFAAALSVGGVQQLVSLLVIGPAVLEVFRSIEQGEPTTFLGTVRGVQRRFMHMVRALARPLAIILVSALSVIGLPWAIERAVRWGFVAQAVILDGSTPNDAPVRSAVVVRDHWWRTAGTLIVLAILGAAPGPVLGIILMVTASASVDFVNALSSLVYAVVLPFSILGSAVLYRRRQAQVTPAPDGTVLADEMVVASQ